MWCRGNSKKKMKDWTVKDPARCFNESHARLLKGQIHFFCNNLQMLIMGTTVMNDYNLLIYDPGYLHSCFMYFRVKWDPQEIHAYKLRLGCTKITAMETSEEEHTWRKDTRNWDNVTLTFYRPASCRKTPLEINFISVGKKEIYSIISILFFTTCHLMHNLISCCK